MTETLTLTQQELRDLATICRVFKAYHAALGLPGDSAYTTDNHQARRVDLAERIGELA